MLGIVSLVTMSAIVQGMENAMKERMVAYGGADKINIDHEDPPDYQEHKRDYSPGITVQDAYALKAQRHPAQCRLARDVCFARTRHLSGQTGLRLLVHGCVGGCHGTGSARH